MIDLDMGAVSEAGYEVVYFSPSGERWVLAGVDGEDVATQRVMLLEDGLQGGVSEPDVAVRSSVTRFGARPDGFTLPPFDFTLDVVVLDGTGRPGVNFRSWRRSWSPLADGKLQITYKGGLSVSTPARLVSMSDVKREPTGPRLIPCTVSGRSLAGVWSATPARFTGTARVVVGGDVAPSVRLLWDGTASSFTLPTGQSVTLPAMTTPSSRFINLDRGMQGCVTTPVGAVDGAVWSRLRGSVFGVTLAPHTPSAWVLGSGLTLEVTPRYLSPWR